MLRIIGSPTERRKANGGEWRSAPSVVVQPIVVLREKTDLAQTPAGPLQDTCGLLMSKDAARVHARRAHAGSQHAMSATNVIVVILRPTPATSFETSSCTVPKILDKS